MKTLLILFCSLTFAAQAQIPPATNNPPTTTSPGNPMQVPPTPQPPALQPYNPTNPSGQPNQIDPAPVQPIPSGTYQSVPGNTVPKQPLPASPKTPNTLDGRPTPSNSVNRLFQDPVKTPREPKAVPVGAPDGSRGKFHKPKKAMSGKTFSHNKIGVKKSRKSKDNGREKSRNTNTTTVGTR